MSMNPSFLPSLSAMCPSLQQSLESSPATRRSVPSRWHMDSLDVDGTGQQLFTHLEKGGRKKEGDTLVWLSQL